MPAKPSPPGETDEGRPGYGFAKVSQETKEKWGKMIERYLRTSSQLKAVFLLIDIRHEPSANDCNMYQWILSNGFEPIIIATKSDKISRSQIDKNIKMIRNKLKTVSGTKIIPFSALNKSGLQEIYQVIDSYLETNEESHIQ